MSLAKAVVSGTVYRAPQKRFTQNDVAIYDFMLNIDEKEETLIRVLAKRKFLAEILDNIGKGDRIIVEGRLQVGMAKAADGSERKHYEIDANSIELLSGTVSPVNDGAADLSSQAAENIVTFSETDYSADTLIDDEEIPF